MVNRVLSSVDAVVWFHPSLLAFSSTMSRAPKQLSKSTLKPRDDFVHGRSIFPSAAFASAGRAVAVLACTATASLADVSTSSALLPGGPSAVGAFTMSSVYGQSTSLRVASAGTTSLEPGFLCIESSDLGIPGDLNGDGHVNGIDLSIVLTYWGPCESSDCPVDLDHDGVVGGVELSVVLGSWG